MRIEPLYTTRREFLTGSLRLVSAAATLPVFLGQTVAALGEPAPRRRGRDDESRILVVVQLSGGNDGLNTVVPYGSDTYYRARPRLAIPAAEVLPLVDGIGLHPALTGLKSLHDDELLAVVQGVGYPNPNRSHFVSMDVWHTADPSLRQHDGWLGRYFDAQCPGADPPEPIQGIALQTEAPLALQGGRFMPLAFRDPGDLAWQAGRKDPRAAATFNRLNNDATPLPETVHPLQQYLQRAALQALRGADQIREAAGAGARRVGRRGRGGGDLAAQLRMVAGMIRADLPTRVYYVSHGSFDTHVNQAGRHQQLLEQLGDALAEFVGTLQEDKLLDRVLVMTFSEFGRRVSENANGGTDHGAAAPMFLVGSGVRPGLHNPHPSMTQLDRGDLAYTCDFRKVYGAVVRDWLGGDVRDVVSSAPGVLRVLK